MYQRQLNCNLVRRCRCSCGRQITPQPSCHGSQMQSRRQLHDSPSRSADERDRGDRPKQGGQRRSRKPRSEEARDEAPRQDRSRRTRSPQQSQSQSDRRRDGPRGKSDEPGADAESRSDVPDGLPYNPKEYAYVQSRNDKRKAHPVDFVPQQTADSVETWRVMKAVEREALTSVAAREQIGSTGPESEEETKRQQNTILRRVVGGEYEHVSLQGQGAVAEGATGAKPGSVLAEVERMLQGNGTYRVADVESLLTRLKKNVGDTALKQ